jgi:hypothetical protein
MAGPAKVEFPGDKKHQKVRMRGIKKASASVQKKLRRNLTQLLEDPHSILPSITANTSRGFGRKDPVGASIREIERVILKRENRKWLSRRMVARRGDSLARSFAGSFLAAHEESFSTVAIFNHPIYGNTSYMRRGTGKAAHLVGIQQHNHPRLRLLAWEEHARAGYYFFSWKGGFVCTSKVAEAPHEWVEGMLQNNPLKWDIIGNSDSDVWIAGNLDVEDVLEGEPTSSGYIRLEFGCGTIVGIEAGALEQCKSLFVESFGLQMMPPKMASIVDAEICWTPDGWPEGTKLPASAHSEGEEVLERWMGLEISDKVVWEQCTKAMINGIVNGFVVKQRWFDTEQQDEFLEALQGNQLEREAVQELLEVIEGGLDIQNSGTVTKLDDKVFRISSGSCHQLLRAIWDDYGVDILIGMFGMDEERAEKLQIRQTKRKQAFGAFLRKVADEESESLLASRFPWESNSLPGVLQMADGLVRSGCMKGVGSTIATARNGASSSEKALGWAWLIVVERAESEGWHFEQQTRDLGGDWVPALSKLWLAGQAILTQEKDSPTADYVAAMETLRATVGILEELPQL